MLTDGITLLDASTAENFQIAAGAELPSSDLNVGELFYLNTGATGLYVYTGSAWVKAGVSSTSDLPEGTNLYYTNGRARGALSAGVGVEYNSTTGVITSATYDISLSIQGKPSSGANVMNFVVPRSMSLPSGLTGTRTRAGTVAAATAVFTIKKNGTSIGTLTFPNSGANSATISFTSAVSFSASDLLQITAPSPQDTALADISILLVATLV
jgi:hypothetical protein